MNKPDILIIGAGPAGLTAAIQLKRYGFTPILLERDHVGGLLRNANRVENYPGFPNGIPGPKLIALFEKQTRRVGVEVTFDKVTRLDYDGEVFLVDAIHNTFSAKYVIVATGTKPKQLPVKIPAQVEGKVFSEVWPLVGVKNKHIIIVGAGDAAFDYALNLSRKNTVTILNRGHETSCLPLLEKWAAENPSIVYRAGVAVRGIEADKTAGRLRVACVRRDGDATLDCDYLIFAIGREPWLDFLTESVKMQERTLIESGKLYFVGDVHNGPFRQTAIAAGDGLRAAMQIYANMEKVR